MNWELTTLHNFELINGVKTIGIKNKNRLVKPGQSYILYSQQDDLFIHHLVVCKIEQENIWLCGDISEKWKIGEALNIRGPIGLGFDLDPLAKNIVLASFGEVQGALLPLITQGLRNQLNISYALTNPWSSFPVEIELLAIHELGEVLSWADCCYFEISWQNMIKYKELLQSFEIFKNKIQILIRTPVLCYGQSECMICSIKTKHGLIKTCKQGNVFWLGDLEEV